MTDTAFAPRARHRAFFASPRVAALPATLLIAGLAASALPAHAQTTLFSNFGSGNAYDTGDGWLLLTGQAIAFQFTPTVSGIVTGMSAPLQNTAGSGAVTAEILNDASGLPGSTVLFDATGTAPGSTSVVAFSSALGTTLNAGTMYWGEIIAPSNGNEVWNRNNAGTMGNVADSQSGGPYSSIGSQTMAAFSVTGTAITAAAAAPEPGSIAFLTLCGVPVLVRILRRRI